MVQYVIGIDLGTTNITCTAAPILKDLEKHPEFIQQSFLQLTEDQTIQEMEILPSFLYFFLEEEKELHCPQWEKGEYTVGSFAKKRGQELPQRMVCSAKSWLSVANVDRRAPILPWQSEIETKLSPLNASVAYLQHVRCAWDQSHPDAPFNEQKVFVTVPASFDPDARQLVQEAVELAGFPETALLEEPQAAFYAWLERHHETWREQLKTGDTLLIVDVGGGTTDFSLIRIADQEGGLSPERVAVGEHILLGGDNIDLALAYQAKKQFEEQGTTVDRWQFNALIQQCRQAKERFLGNHPPELIELTVQGRGRKLIGGALKTEMTHEWVKKIVLDGFAPFVEYTECPSVKLESGFREEGLPYAADPRFTAQMATFLKKVAQEEDEFHLPTAILFNGGTLKSSALRHRLIEQLSQWAVKLKKEAVRILKDPDFDRAVSWGAAYYGLAREGKGVRIRGGTHAAYFVGIEDAMPAVPGLEPSLTAFCIVPFGLEEGNEAPSFQKKFSLVLDQKIQFRFFSLPSSKFSNGKKAEVGLSLSQWKGELRELPSIEAFMDSQGLAQSTVSVQLQAKVTELGVLELWCFSDEGKKWKLEFVVRNTKQEVKV